jgi:hypothetical protein
MLTKNNISCIPKSQSLDSLNKQLPKETSILSSTREQEQETQLYKNTKGRRAMLPTSYKPQLAQDLVTVTSKNDLSDLEEKFSKDVQRKSHEENTQRFITENKNDIKDSNIPTSNSSILRKETLVNVNITTQPSDCFNKISDADNETEIEDDNNADSFDNFIFQNFLPYSGRENVISWLHATEDKFNLNHIGRKLRFQAISLLVGGVAKDKYIKHRTEIRSYDDFYEFLLSEFAYTDDSSSPRKFRQTHHNNPSDLTEAGQTKSAIEPNHLNSNSSNLSKSTGLLSSFSSTAKGNLGVTDSVGETPVIKESTGSDSLSNSMFDQTQNDLRKAIVGNLIKNPKTFKGGKADVKKWIEDIEHLFDLAHIPESTRLDLISYSLRGDALEWFKNNRTSFTSWSVFVVELKRAFTSSFHEELAFQKLELYFQGENQLIRSYFNEVLKLCKEADPSMSEATKLKHLLSKTKPSIQYEVRKKKPTSTAEFLEYAKDAEELMQLSQMSSDTISNQTSARVVQPQPTPKPSRAPNFTPSLNFRSDSYPSNYSRHFDQNNQFPQTRNPYPYRNSPSFSTNTPSSPKPRFNNNPSQPYRPRYSNDSIAKSNDNRQPPKNNSATPKPARQSTANAIDVPDQSSDLEPLQETFSSVSCSRCSQFGHEASACPNF